MGDSNRLAGLLAMGCDVDAKDAFDFFLPLANIERYEGVDENPADIKATARLAKCV